MIVVYFFHKNMAMISSVPKDSVHYVVSFGHKTSPTVMCQLKKSKIHVDYSPKLRKFISLIPSPIINV